MGMGTMQPVSCLICGDEGPGLDIRGRCICSSCEELLLYLPVGHGAYEYCKERIKLLWVD